MMVLVPKDWTVEYFLANESQCVSALEDLDALKEIPSLNNAPSDHFKDGQLVCFRGMLQDTHNPEFYFKSFQVLNKNTGVHSTRSGMYTDAASCQPDERILLDSNSNESSQRQTWVVISIPGLNDWAKEISSSATNNITQRPTESTSNSSCKRSLDENDEPMELEPSKKKEKTFDEHGAGSSRMHEDSNASGIVSRDHLLNFPVPNEGGKACIVKIYEEIPYKLNQIFDIVGFLSFDEIKDSEKMDNDCESQTHYPPTSIVPRLHAIKVREVDNNISGSNDIISKAESIRGDLKIVLTQLLFGDEIAADYLICHLISSVYLRKDCLCLGAFSLNISNFPKEYANFTKDFYDILKQIIAKSYKIELTLENLNEMSLVPKKDYDCDRLTSGILQLSKNTHLIIDETSLTTGHVTAFGRQNYQIIKDLIDFQKLSYDFKFFTTEFETDIPVLILSEVKSFIPCQNRIVIKPDPDVIKIYPQVIEASKQYLTNQDRLNDIRKYINIMKYTQFHFSEDLSATIEDDFVRLRQADSKFSADNLHSLMVLARLMSLSHGITALNTEMWKRSLEMEMERMGRVS